MKPSSLVSTHVCIDLFGPIFLGEKVLENAFESIAQITQIADPQNIFIFCGHPKTEQMVRLLLEVSGFFEKTGILPECLIFSEERTVSDFQVIISSDLEYLITLPRTRLKILIGCDAERLHIFQQDVLAKLSYGEEPKWNTLLIVSNWIQNLSIILNWIRNPDQVTMIPKSTQV